MKKGLRVGAVILSVLLFIAILAVVTRGREWGILQPEGFIANEQYKILIFACVLSALVIIPVFTMIYVISKKYNAKNKNAEYKPDWEHNTKAEIIWWGIPIILIAILSVVIWRTSHSLDPYKELDSNKKPVTVQVVALQWKWLFIYPEYNVASVNYLHIPEKTPINLQISADAPMSSFWIPKLGGQVYAMNGMTTKLHLEADNIGTYQGVNTNINGEGYAHMNFVTESSSEADFSAWLASSKQSGSVLNLQSYETLAKPSIQESPIIYKLDDAELFNSVIMKYMEAKPKAKKEHE